mgnify:CR=1 FL=1
MLDVTQVVFATQSNIGYSMDSFDVAPNWNNHQRGIRRRGR